MNKRLQLLKHLYQEESAPEALKALLEDPELREEFGHLEEVRDILASGMGRMQPRAPEAAVERVMDAAFPKQRPIQFGPLRRPRRRRVFGLAGALTGVAATAALLFLFVLPRNEPPELPSAQEEVAADTILTWDDTDEFIRMQQSLTVVRQRTSPLLWDESEVMRLDSLPDAPASSIPGLETVSTNPQ